MSKNNYHPALMVSNVKNSIHIVLEMENVQYAMWAELFKIHAISHQVIHHIIPPATPLPAEDPQLWITLDATVLQWIYSTISVDLLQTIIELDTTTMSTWDRLCDIFQDNQQSRVVTLEQEFSLVRMKDFPNVSTYCKKLKELADQLRNVGAPVTNNRLVLQLVVGLSEAYNGIGTLLRQSNPLPAFYQARSMLTSEEVGLAKKAATGASPVIMMASSPSSSGFVDNSGQNRTHSGDKNNRKNNNKNCGGKRGGSDGQAAMGRSDETMGRWAAATPTFSQLPAAGVSGGPSPHRSQQWGPWRWAMGKNPYVQRFLAVVAT
ncbi:hypothetical protein K7X08_021361 [Anisodus acutangulus]|uniref:Uncharacterized protein n=1 Tax=Anisodus acutangulus TaxID=402998 RepID=A0A9Q1LZ93_9SOLA|nr:hypothetical protein K7X08_021361 [Anisodus acutangulus]